MVYKCQTCGEEHEGIPDIGFRWPDPYFAVAEEERESRIQANTDICNINDEEFYVRGVLLIPVRKQDQRFGLGV